jgi:hypothetical protein
VIGRVWAARAGAMSLALFVGIGCGGAQTHQASAASASGEPDAVGMRGPYSFSREVMRTRRDERNRSELRGELRLAGGGADAQLLITLVQARYTQGDTVVREIDPAAGATPLRFAQALAPDGGASAIDADTALTLGSELTQALELFPIGSTGLSRIPDHEGDVELVVGWPRTSGLPRSVAVHCVTTRTMSARAVRCEGTLDRDLEVSSEARSQGITAAMRGRVSLEALLDANSSLARGCRHHLELDVIERLGPYEEHEAAVVDIVTELVPIAE